MRNLIDFLIRNVHWWLFVLLMFVSAVLIMRDNAYQRSIYLSSANEVCGGIYSLSSSLTSYVGLQKDNEALLKRMTEMEARIQELEAYIRDRYDTTAYLPILERSGLYASGYTFVPAHVVNNSVTKTDNYITLDKGTEDGVGTDMGVISSAGVVGVVSLVSDHYSVVIPILSSKSFLSCKIQRTNHFGPLVWDGKSPRFACLNNVPRHVDFSVQDTIVSSGFSDILPENIMVGTVAEYEKNESDEFHSLKIALSTDFHSLKEVLVIGKKSKEEQDELERRIK
ncbi:MAG: rod shape-determining protein MreC [Dysgonamonadaceae bacterium]|jgi:rod shape-determining protein MreC|nr:rod shape-determining protein MreC [Dysgonamonadaceae bacterium]